MDSPRHILITGASSGIGRALALEYAAEGRVIGLIGRNRVRLEQVAAECRSRGATVHVGAIDVRDREPLCRWATEFDAATPIDLLVANAGVLVRMPGAELEPA